MVQFNDPPRNQSIAYKIACESVFIWTTITNDINWNTTFKESNVNYSLTRIFFSVIQDMRFVVCFFISFYCIEYTWVWYHLIKYVMCLRCLQLSGALRWFIEAVIQFHCILRGFIMPFDRFHISKMKTDEFIVFILYWVNIKKFTCTFCITYKNAKKYEAFIYSIIVVLFIS